MRLTPPRFALVLIPLLCALLSACSNHTSAPPVIPETPMASPAPTLPPSVYSPRANTAVRAVCERLGLDPEKMAGLDEKPLYTFTEAEVDLYLRFLHEVEPDLARRIIHIGRKNIGQPYEIYLLGEFPFELYDAAPLYSLTHSDCVVFSEHCYAMALAHDWTSFFMLLQRIRYKDGRIGILTRNHYTEADWDRNNSWLVREITDEIGGERVKPFYQKCDRARFFKKWNLGQDIPVEELRSSYIPGEAVAEIADQLRDGDFVNVIYSSGPGQWASHTGLIARGADGTVNFLHSTKPTVREEPIARYIESRWKNNEQRRAEGNKSLFVGFKFLRLENDPLSNLRALDGPDAPRVSGPAGAINNPPRTP